MKKQELLAQINSKLETTPLIYFSREAERAIGLEGVLKNYHICCIEDGPIVDQLISKGFSIFCLERAGITLETKSTSQLISDPATIGWLEKIIKSATGPNTVAPKFYALTFLNTRPFALKVKQLGGMLLNIEFDLNQKLENKLAQYKYFEEIGLSIPRGFLIELKDIKYIDLVNKIGAKFVIQIERAHTGSGTYIISSEEEYLKVYESIKGNIVKVTEFIEGDTYTFNGCITKEKYFVNGMQYQITGIPSLTASAGSTVGNDFSLGNKLIKNEAFKANTINEVKKLTTRLFTDGYLGLFGIDLVVKDNVPYLIEINARQTANIPLQTQLELAQSEQAPLQLIHLAAFLQINAEYLEFSNFTVLNGSQLFMRALKDDVLLDHELKSGVYRLQSDNSAREFKDDGFEYKEDAIFIDEQNDKSLIFQHEAYRVDQVESAGFLLLSQRKNTIKNKYEELLRLQFNTQIVDSSGNVTPWILEAMKAIREIIS